MKKVVVLLFAIMLTLCSCSYGGTQNNSSSVNIGEVGEIDTKIVGKWIDVETEQIIEYTENGFYYEYINESFTTDDTRFLTYDGKIYYYLDGDTPDGAIGINYEIKDDHLIVADVIEYKPMDLKTSLEEME